MGLCSYHFPLGEKSFKDIRAGLLDMGLVSVIDDLMDRFRPYTEHLNVDIPAPIIELPNVDFLSTQDKQCLCRIELDEERRGETFLQLHLFSSGQEAEKQLVTCCQKVCEHEGITGTLSEATRSKTLKKQLAKLSVNGKMLAKPDFMPSFEALYEHRTRELLRPISKAFTTRAVPEAITSSLFGKAEDRELLQTLLHDEALFSHQYLIGCNNCTIKLPPFAYPIHASQAFANRRHAETTITKLASKKCPSCGRNLGIIDAFAMTEGAHRGLEQGLWLEHLVHRTIEPLSIFSCSGRSINSFELDVVSLLCENVVLFECTDGSFGETDYARLIMKADVEELDVDVIGIVTTQPLHENVKRLIERDEKEERRQVLRVDGLSNAEDIKAGIMQQVTELQRNFAKGLFMPSYRPHYLGGLRISM